MPNPAPLHPICAHVATMIALQRQRPPAPGGRWWDWTRGGRWRSDEVAGTIRDESKILAAARFDGASPYNYHRDTMDRMVRRGLLVRVEGRAMHHVRFAVPTSSGSLDGGHSVGWAVPLGDDPGPAPPGHELAAEFVLSIPAYKIATTPTGGH